MNVFRTFIVSADKGPLAVRITDALATTAGGMFMVFWAAATV